MIERARRLLQEALRTQFIRDASMLTGAQLLVSVLAFVQGIVVAAWLGPEEYGIALLIISVPSMMFAILDARTSAAAVKYLTQFHTDRAPDRARAMCKLAYALDFGISVLALALVAGVARWAETRIVHSEGTAALIILYATAYLPRSLTATSQSVLTVVGGFQAMAIAQLVAKTVGVVSVLGLVLAGWGVRGVIYGRMAEIVVMGLVLGALAFTAVRKTWGGSWIPAHLGQLDGYRREIFRFVGFTEITELVHVVSKQADVVLLGYFAGPVQAGYFGFARRMTGTVATIVEPLQSVLYPRLSRMWAEQDVAGMRRTLRRFVLGIAVPLAAGILLAIPLVWPFTHYVVGEQWDPAVTVTQVFFVSTATWMATCWLRPLFHAMGEVRFLFLNATLVNALALVGFLLTAEPFGALGLGCVHLLVGGLIGPTIATRHAFRRLGNPGAPDAHST